MAVNINRIINIQDQVIAPTSEGLTLNMLHLTSNGRIPSSYPALFFRNILEVANFFGKNSDEYKCADVYFKGYDGSDKKPNNIVFGLLMNTDSKAWYAGNTPSPIELFKAVSDGSFSVKSSDNTGQVNQHDVVGLDFTNSNSYSDIASEITSKLTTLNIGITCIYDSSIERFVFENSIVGNNSKFEFFVEGTQGTGIGSLLGVLQAENPIISNGYTAMTGSDNMDYITKYFENFISISVIQSVSQEFQLSVANWVSNQGTRYVYVVNTTDIRATKKNDTTTIAPLVKDKNGIIPVYGDNTQASFVGGIGASINYDIENGVITFAGKKQDGLKTVVDNSEDYDNLIDNGYNVYALFSNVASQYKYFQKGTITGDYNFIDSYYNQVWLKDNMINGLARLIQNSGRIQFTAVGIQIVQDQLEISLDQGVVNGTIDTNVDLSQEVINEINRDAGRDISTRLASKGYAVVFDEITQEKRVKRELPTVKIWYTYGGAIQSINIDLAQIQ